MISAIKERIVGNARHELVTNFSGGHCLPWWAISKAEHVPNPVKYPRFRKVFEALSTANKGNPIFISRQNFIKKLVVGTDGTVWFNPSSFSLSSTCMAGNHPDDPFYDPNGSKGSAFVNGENILVGGGNLEFSYRVKDEEPHATIDLSAVSIEEFNEFFESSQFSHPAFNPKEFNKKFIELLERGCNTKLKLPTCHEGSSVQNLEFGEYSQRVIFRDFESNEVVSNKYYSAAVLMEGVVLGMDNGFLKQRVVKQLKLKMADDGTSYTECLIGNYPESAPVDLVELGDFIRKKPSLGLLVDRLFRARLSGIGQSRLSTFVYDLSQESGLDEAFSEDLEDMAAALEGHCCSSYILHPSHF